jgi:hypothetical protein
VECLKEKALSSNTNTKKINKEKIYIITIILTKNCNEMGELREYSVKELWNNREIITQACYLEI